MGSFDWRAHKNGLCPLNYDKDDPMTKEEIDQVKEMRAKYDREEAKSEPKPRGCTPSTGGKGQGGSGGGGSQGGRSGQSRGGGSGPGPRGPK